MKIVRDNPRPTVTIYQNEDNVLLVFSAIKDGKYRASVTGFENNWHDGGASGIGGFESRKELNEYLKENHYKKKGKAELNVLCWDKHVVETYKRKVDLGGGRTKIRVMIHGGTATCRFNKNHKGKHEGTVSGGFDSEDIVVTW